MLTILVRRRREIFQFEVHEIHFLLLSDIIYHDIVGSILHCSSLVGSNVKTFDIAQISDRQCQTFDAAASKYEHWLPDTLLALTAVERDSSSSAGF